MSDGDPSRPDETGDDREGALTQLLRTLVRSFGLRRNGGDSLREALEELIEEHPDEEAPINSDERAMLVNLLKFGELRVDDVMVPRADIVAADQATPIDEVVRTMREAGHSRLPVYRESLDDIIGMVHVRDLLRYWGMCGPSNLADAARPLLFVPPSMQVRDLLLQMRATHIHMAMVVDEYGGIDGLVTIEDLVEEIVGEIQDEHDSDEAPLVVERSGGALEADARATVAELESWVGVSLLPEDREEDIDTLGGLVVSLAGRVPARGELIKHPAGLQFEVVDADPRRIKRLRIQNVPPAPE